MNPIVKAVEWIFYTIDGIVDVLEGTTVNTVSALSPWLAPVAPATLVYLRLISKMQFSNGQALIVALVIEFIGLSSVSTIIRFWQHNKYYSYLAKDGGLKVSRKKSVPVELPVATFVFYLVIVLSVTVLLELPIAEQHLKWLRVITVFLVSMLSVPAAIIVASRAMYKSVLKEIDGLRNNQKVSENYGKLPTSNMQVSETYTNLSNPGQKLSEFNGDWRNLTKREQYAIGKMSKREIIRRYGVSDRTAHNWITYANSLERDN